MKRKTGILTAIGVAAMVLALPASAQQSSLLQLSSPPRLLSDVASQMQYPAEALNKGWQGRVVFTLQISATGAVQSCDITVTSGYAVLDSATCNLMYGASFAAARDMSGNPVSASYRSAIRWTLPNE